ncbi:MAG: DUF4159 domain-containing protein, partial [Alphaproteobacteria bacterium GM202ARS2]|nr:DUF4159 domain-containing protein [Alphaproteobacteria bacterium GM202ARS2]
PYIPTPDNDTPPANTLSNDAPLLLVIDNGWATAAHWHTHMQTLRDTLASLPDHRFILLPTATPPDPNTLSILSARQAQTALDSLNPHPWHPQNAIIAQTLTNKDTNTPRLNHLSAILWSHDAIDSPDKNTLKDTLQAHADRLNIPFYSLTEPSLSLPIVLAPPPKTAQPQLLAYVLTPPTLPTQRADSPSYHLQGFDADNRLLFDKPLTLDSQETPVYASAEQAHFLHQLHNLRLRTPQHQRHAATVLLRDSQSRQPSIFVLNPSSESPPPLLNSNHYITQALNRPTRNASLANALKQKADIIFWHDQTTRIPTDEQSHLLSWLEQGGILVRFASPHVQDLDADPNLLPAPLYEITASTRGFLADSTDSSTLHFAEHSPFHQLPSTPTHIAPTFAFIEPPPDVHIWAYTDDHRPLISARRVGNGWLVFFHTPLHPLRSDLALDTLFPTILATLTRLRTYQGSTSLNSHTPSTLWQPLQLLDGWGQLSSPTATTQALNADARPSPQTPPGIYATTYERRALNLGDNLSPPIPFINAPPPLQPTPPQHNQHTLQGWLLTAIILLLAIHTLLLLRRAHRPSPTQPSRLSTTSTATAAALVFCYAFFPCLTSAQDLAGDAPFYAPRIGYMLSNDKEQDSLSHKGLSQLTRFINARTVAQLAEPLALTPQSPLLPFVPLIYWPVTSSNTPLSPQDTRTIEHYLSKGGIILFDTLTPKANLEPSLSLPPLTPIDDEHTVTRSFFLLPLNLWRKTNTPVPWSDHHAQAHIPTASVFASQQNWAQLWQNHLYMPQHPSLTGILTQQTLAMRFGLNLVLYALTGNYKRDQIHALTIIERLRNKP